MGFDILLVFFTANSDKDCIWCNSPWSFDKNLIIMKNFEGDLQPSKIEMSHALFWVRVFDLPLHCMLSNVGWLIGWSIGNVVPVDAQEDNTCWGEFVCLRVNVNVLEPLPRGKFVNVEGLEPVWANFKYEKLPNLSYICSCLVTMKKIAFSGFIAVDCDGRSGGLVIFWMSDVIIEL